MLVLDNCELFMAFVLGGLDLDSLVQNIECAMEMNLNTQQRAGGGSLASSLEIRDCLLGH